MKFKNIYNIILGVVAAVSMASCEDYLDTNNEQNVPAHEALTSLEALKATTANLYTTPWLYFHKHRFYQLGDFRANNLHYSTGKADDNNAQATFNESKENTSVEYAWGSLYNVITQAGYIIHDYAPYCVANGVCSQADANVCIAEARFMRAIAYWYLAMYWHDVPIIENAAYVDAMAYANRFEDVIQYAICEAEFAAKWLPITPYYQGRVSRVSAEVLLSRLYLTAADYAKGNHISNEFESRVLNTYYADNNLFAAKSSLANFYYSMAEQSARMAINNANGGGYGLMDDYEEIFRVQNNNCKEVLFAIQVVGGSTTYGLQNELQSAFNYDRCITHNYGQAWNTFAGYDFCQVAKRRGGLNRNRGNLFIHGQHYSYLYHEQDTCKTRGEEWTVNRNRATIPVKKFVVGGPQATGGVAINGNSGFCTPFMRLSEAYLNHTEAMMGCYDVEETTNPAILEGVNAVRRRAYRMEIANGTYPGDYPMRGGAFTLDSLLQERRMEFFVEGQTWPTIVRRSFRGPQHLKRMLDYQNNKIYEIEGDTIMGCHRLYAYTYRAADETSGFDGSIELRLRNGEFVVSRQSRECVHKIPDGSWCHNDELGNSDNLWSMIYPPSETMQDPNLLKAPIPFDFSEIIANKDDYANK